MLAVPLPFMDSILTNHVTAALTDRNETEGQDHGPVREAQTWALVPGWSNEPRSQQTWLGERRDDSWHYVILVDVECFSV